jgi:hypothetical protein
MVQFIPAKDDWADAFRKMGSGVAEGYMGRTDERALQKSILGLGPNPTPRDVLNAITNTKTYTPKAKQQALSNYLGVEQFEELKRKAQAQEEIAGERNRIAGLGKQAPEDRTSSINNFLAQGYNQEEAEALTNPYVPNSVKQAISKRVENELARGMRQQAQIPSEKAAPGIESNSTGQTAMNGQNVVKNQEMPLSVEETIAPIGEAIVEGVKNAEAPKAKKEEWPKLPMPANTTAAEQEKWRDKNQTFNNKLLREIKEKSTSHTNALLRYNRLSTLNNSRKLPEGMGRLVINPGTGEPYAVASLVGLVNKETQDFVKTMNDFMIDAKNYFGSRVTNFDVQAFKSRLPTLLNTADGRRLIIEQMKLMEDLQITHNTELERGLKHYGRNASYSDVQNVVDRNTEEKEAQIINKVNNLDQAANYMDLMANDPRFKDTTLMQSPNGKFKAIPNSKINEAKSRGYISW